MTAPFRSKTGYLFSYFIYISITSFYIYLNLYISYTSIYIYIHLYICTNILYYTGISLATTS